MRSFAACLLGAMLVLEASGPAPAAAQPGAVTISPESAPAGTIVTIAGTGCTKRGPDPAVVHVAVESLGLDVSVPTTIDGAWSTDVVVTTAAGPGPHLVIASCVRKPAPDPYLPVTLTVLATSPTPTSEPPPPSAPVTTTAPGSSSPSSPTAAPATGGSPATNGSTASTALPPGASPTAAPGDPETVPTEADPGSRTQAATGAPRRDANPSTETASPVSSSSSPGPAVAVSVAASSVALIGGLLFVRRRRRQTGTQASTGDAVLPLAVPVTGHQRRDEPGPEASDAPVPPATAPRPEHQVTDVVRTMAVLELVLRTSVRPGVSFVLDATTDEVKAPLGPHELEALVVPLVEYAAAPLSEGGTVRVVVGRGPCPADQSTEWALVVVAGTGPANADHRRAAPSELVQVRDSVAAMGGHLDITSVARHGTTITMALPLVAEADSSSADQDDPATIG